MKGAPAKPPISPDDLLTVLLAPESERLRPLWRARHLRIAPHHLIALRMSGDYRVDMRCSCAVLLGRVLRTSVGGRIAQHAAEIGLVEVAEQFNGWDMLVALSRPLRLR